MKNIKLAYIRCSWKLNEGRFWNSDDIKGNLLTDLNLSFAYIDSAGRVQFENKSYFKEQINALKEKYPELRINLSIGGWGAEGFSKASSSVKTRARFTKSAVKLLQEMELDGLDIDWEFPVGPDWGQSIKSSPADKENFIHLLKSLKNALNAEEKLTEKKYTLSAAIPSSSWFFKKNSVHKASEICDYLNLMCYDYYGDWSETTGFNASLYTNPNDKNGWSTKNCFDLLLEKNVCLEKIVLGFPSYGFAWKGVPDNNTHGLFQKPQAFIGNFDYNQLEELYNEGYEKYFDDISKQAYRYNPEKQIFVYYPSKAFLSELTAFSKQYNLAGLMYWEYGHDINGSLLEIMNEELNKY